MGSSLQARPSFVNCGFWSAAAQKPQLCVLLRPITEVSTFAGAPKEKKKQISSRTIVTQCMLYV